ncbi:MAG: hypothetical protein K1X90_09505 [Candidatus Kapabacteria bacterium]|nr:hypothetical protein [Candidatus Kapabacteria bacterium]
MTTTSTASFFRNLIAAVALLTLFASQQGVAQGRQPVTTHPGGSKVPCRENLTTTVTKTPWKFSGLGFLRSNSVFDTLEIQSTSAQLATAIGGNWGNYTLVLQEAAELFNYEFNLYGQWTRTVTVTTKGTKCVNGQPVAVNDVKTFDEETKWTHLMGPLVWSALTPTKLKILVDNAAKSLPK